MLCNFLYQFCITVLNNCERKSEKKKKKNPKILNLSKCHMTVSGIEQKTCTQTLEN